MKTILYIFSFIIGVAFFFYPQTTVSLSTGSPGGKTGSPSDNTDCTQCHTVLSTTSALTSITSNIPSSGYVPGNTYTITANINALSTLNGFEITCEENNTNLKTGTFFITNPNETQLVNNGAAVTHTAGGNNLHTWSFDWEAPIAGTGDVNFYGSFIEAGYPFGANFSDYFSSYVLEVNEFVPQPQTYVPDDNFEAYLEANGLGNGILNDDSVFVSAIDTVINLDVNNQSISDLTGIEGFADLNSLVCESNNITTIDVTQNIALTHLKARYNQLTNLDISNNISLTYLECDYNQITNLNVSNNINLTSLSCAANQLSILDVSQNIALIELDCFDNYLTNLDVSTNTNLTAFNPRGNQLTSLDLSNNIALTEIDCGDNQLSVLDVSNNIILEGLECYNNQLTSLDITQNHSLGWLECHNNQLTELDLRNGNNTNMNIDIAGNTNLTCIDVDDPTYSSINWTNIDPQHYFSDNCANNCVDSLQVTDITITPSTSTITIGIYNGYNSFLSYPYVLYTLDANGDTVHTGMLNSFGQFGLDTSWYSYPLFNTNLPTPPFSVYFVYTGGFNFLTDTCVLTYNMFTTNIIEETGVQPKKLLKIVDVLGRETRIIKNKPLFYIYNNGVREKKIIVE
tara:strand:- start:1766 stop:3649 length:1884 start_codon:yes stop_codon:yes gene_type:complete